MNGNSTLKDLVYEYITTHIIKGDLQPNQKISESEICETLGVSRTPVREALIHLSSEGVLQNIPHKGFIIKPLNEEQAAELYEVIGVLDGLAASMACDNLDEETIREMDFYTLSMDLAINTGNFSMYYKQQEIFHRLYVEKCGNKTLEDLILELKRKLLKKNYQIEGTERKKEILLSTNSQHKEMMILFKKKDKKALSAYMADVHWKPENANWESF